MNHYRSLTVGESVLNEPRIHKGFQETTRRSLLATLTLFSAPRAPFYWGYV